jgi:hypothetical protein
MGNVTKQNLIRTSDADLAATAKQAIAQLKALKESLKQFGFTSLTINEREHSNGKFREGESTAIATILDTVDAKPGLFEALAPFDHGTDDKVVETGPSREALVRRNALAPLLTELQALTEMVSDEVLCSGEIAKDVSVPAYAIIKANAALNKDVKSLAATAINHYGMSARTRAANKRKAEKQNRAK